MWGGWHFPFKGCLDKTIIVETRQSGKVLQGQGEVFWKRSKMVEIAVEIHMFMPTEVVEICRGGDLPTETAKILSPKEITNNSETLAQCQAATQPFSKRITNISVVTTVLPTF